MTSDTAKYAIDWLSAGVVVATIVNWLPAIAAFLTIVWTLLRIWDDPKVQRLIAWIERQFDKVRAWFARQE